MLRREAPVERTLNRWAATDVELGGQTIKRGELVIAILSSADRDPARFPEPDPLDVEREDNKHLAFGRGSHYCLGAPLARLETEIALETLLRRLPAAAPRRRPPTSSSGARRRLPPAGCDPRRVVASGRLDDERQPVDLPDDDGVADVRAGRAAGAPDLACDPHLPFRPTGRPRRPRSARRAPPCRRSNVVAATSA